MGPPPFHGKPFKERIELKGATEPGLEWLALQKDAHINGLEISLDLVFESGSPRDRTFVYFNEHIVRLHHRQEQKIKLIRSSNGNGESFRELSATCAETRYDAGRTSPNQLVFYKQEFCRVTGEIAPVLHLEWRANRHKAVQRLGIVSGKDLLDFDHGNFWSDKLLLQDTDRGRLGRMICNLRDGTKRRTSTLNDKRLGYALLRHCETIQQFRDQFGSRFGRVLIRIPNNMWIPN